METYFISNTIYKIAAVTLYRSLPSVNMILFQMIIQVSQVKNLLIRRKKKPTHFIAEREQIELLCRYIILIPLHVVRFEQLL